MKRVKYFYMGNEQITQFETEQEATSFVKE